MTDTDWRTMAAGPELDAIVATRVMAWTPADRHAYGWGAGPLVWLTGEDPDAENTNPTFQGFSPSTNIAHAWLVVQKLATPHLTLTSGNGNTSRWRCAFTAEGPVQAAPTAPLAIVRAALAVVEGV